MPIAAVGHPTANWLEVPAIGLSTPVIDSACTAPVTHGATVRDLCAAQAVTYRVGHDPGIFAPVARVQPGAVIKYWYGADSLHSYLVTAINLVPRSQGDAYMFDGSWSHLDLQNMRGAGRPDGLDSGGR